MALYGDKTTTKVTLDMMIRHGQSVRKGVKKSYMVVDMPKNTYNNKIQAFKNAKKIITQTKCDAVKLEGGKKIINIVNYLIKKKIKVVNDQYNNPTSAESLALAIYESIKSNLNGVVHWADKELINRYEFSLKIAKVFGLDI